MFGDRTVGTLDRLEDSAGIRLFRKVADGVTQLHVDGLAFGEPMVEAAVFKKRPLADRDAVWTQADR